MKRRILILSIGLLLSLGVHAQCDTVLFSASGGFYEDVFQLELYNYYAQNHIRYTTNGNRPTAQSNLYVQPLALNESLYSKSDIYTVQISPDDLAFVPDSVRHCIVIRAAVFDENDSCISQVATNSYFIRSLGCDTHGMPVVSLCADSLDLFNYESGIMVPGIYFNPLFPTITGNYYMKGREWERLANVEFYELDNSGINQQAGLRTHGKLSRRQVQKGLKLYAREEYGKKRFKHRFFQEIPHNSFKHLALKPYMSAWNGCGCADYISGCIARQLNVESLASRPSVLFLNGEYWGVYFVGEKPDERYLEDHFNIDIETVNILNGWYGEYDCGSPDNFLGLFDRMSQVDLKDDAEYAYISQYIDIENFIDYQVFEIFSYNLDWPANNVRFWQLGDGKFRWIFFDGDACFQLTEFDAFGNAVYDGDDLYPSNMNSTLFFRKLLENDTFKAQFASRFETLLHTVFAYENTKPFYQYITQTLQPEIPHQSERFGKPSSFDSWNYYSIYVVDDFLKNMPEKILHDLNDFVIGLPEPLAVTFDCFPNPSHDDIHLLINSVNNEDSEICIYDMMGRIVFDMPYRCTEGINEITIRPNLEAGIYLLKVGSYTHRIVRY